MESDINAGFDQILLKCIRFTLNEKLALQMRLRFEYTANTPESVVY